MKKRMMTASVLAASLLLGACGSKTYEARDINPAIDICKICNMTVANEKYAGQVVLKNGDYEVFDDIGCLMTYYNDKTNDDIGAAFVKNFSGDKWVEASKAVYVSGDDIMTPMSYGVVAFETTAEAQQFMEKEGGSIVTFDDVKAMDWEAHA